MDGRLPIPLLTGRNLNFSKNWIVRPLIPPYFCIIKIDCVKGHIKKWFGALIKFHL